MISPDHEACTADLYRYLFQRVVFYKSLLAINFEKVTQSGQRADCLDRAHVIKLSPRLDLELALTHSIRFLQLGVIFV